MQNEPVRSLEELARHVGRYPEEAFLFVRDGLTFAAEQAHGQETSAHKLSHKYIAAKKIDWDEFVTRYHAGSLPDKLRKAIEEVGGPEKINRHVSGRELCWGLRAYALQRWGMLATEVLVSWNIRNTLDFGRIVFGFIDFDLMQKQPADTLNDFTDVYNFEEAFEEGFRAALRDDAKDESTGD